MQSITIRRFRQKEEKSLYGKTWFFMCSRTGIFRWLSICDLGEEVTQMYQSLFHGIYDYVCQSAQLRHLVFL